MNPTNLTSRGAFTRPSAGNRANFRAERNRAFERRFDSLQSIRPMEKSSTSTAEMTDSRHELEERDGKRPSGYLNGASRLANGDADSGSSEPGEPSQDAGTALMLRARDGDDEAFAELFQLHSAMLFRLACRMTRCESRGEEIVQEAFLRIYRRRESYEPSARFSTYAYRVVANLCINDSQLAAHKAPSQSLNGDDGPLARGGEIRLEDPSSPNGEAHAIRAQSLRRVNEELEAVPAAARAALFMVRLEGMSYEEIAEVLDVSVSAAKSMVFRATARLRKKCGDVLEGV